MDVHIWSEEANRYTCWAGVGLRVYSNRDRITLRVARCGLEALPVFGCFWWFLAGVWCRHFAGYVAWTRDTYRKKRYLTACLEHETNNLRAQGGGGERKCDA